MKIIFPHFRVSFCQAVCLKLPTHLLLESMKRESSRSPHHTGAQRQSLRPTQFLLSGTLLAASLG